MMKSRQRAPLPPRWFIRSFWVVQRAAYAVTGGRFRLRTARADRWGMLRLRTVGRRSDKERTAILGYFEDGPDLVTLAQDAHAALGSRQTQVVILEPRSDAQSRGNRSVRSVVYAVPTQQIDQEQRPGCWSTIGETESMTRHEIPGAARALLALLVIGLVAVGCTSAVAKATEMGASCDQFGTQKIITQTTEMAVGDQVKVTLCSNPTTGFSWQEPEISDTAAVSLADKSFGAPTSASAPVVGAAGTENITLKATAKGTSTVVLRYSKPWVGGTSGEWTYTLTVTVR
jgi:predicted secreted protein